ncbi:MAG: MFS transporter [Acidobacteria bacterium]|nr:MFS transporter [Acidobacteriota bacterium]
MLGLEPSGLWSSLHLVTMAGIVIVVIGYGMYMPAAYAAVRQFTNPKTSGMGYAMLYALMNLGGYLRRTRSCFARTITWESGSRARSGSTPG